MAIFATNTATKRELIPAGNYVARCYQMIHIGTVPENYQGEIKEQNKVRIGWELPTELKVFNEERGEQPLIIGKEYTLSMNEKANLRKMLASWRGKDFNEDEARKFDITVLIGKPCMLNIIHKPGVKDPSMIYEEIATISPMPKGFTCPDQINETQLLTYEDWNGQVYEALPDFIKEKIKKSNEYNAMMHPQETNVVNRGGNDENGDDLPF